MESKEEYTLVVDKYHVSDKYNDQDGGDLDSKDTLDTLEVKFDDDDDDKESNATENLIYRLDDRPPWLILISASIQHIILALPGALTCSSVVADVACVPWDHHIRAKLFCGTLFMCGLSTILQTAFGVRLPIFQGSSSSFLVPLLALSRDNECEAMATHTSDKNSTTSTNDTLMLENSLDQSVDEALIYNRLQKMSGALMLASLVEITVGAMGLLRFLTTFIGPITIAVTISLIGVTICKLPVIYGRPQYLIALGTMLLVLMFILHLSKVRIPLPKCGNKPRKFFAIFQVLPIMAAVIVMWSLTWVLTVLDVFTDDKTLPEFKARADAKVDMIDRSPWFQLSYPGMFGPPQKDLALTTSFVVAIFASMVESVGDYFAAQKVCGVRTPSSHALSRGILLEGLASMLSGSMALGHATTSYSGNISILTLTQTASRTVMYAAGIILIAMSLIGKLGAAMTTIPFPVLGGVSVIIVGSLLSIGLSNLQLVDMRSNRNILVVGVSLGSGIILPQILSKYPEVFETGYTDVDQLIHALIGTPMFVGAVVATILDNTSPGSKKSRGFQQTEDKDETNSDLMYTEGGQDPYTWSWYPALAQRVSFLRFIPFLPK